jgi:hypothetical protein
MIIFRNKEGRVVAMAVAGVARRKAGFDPR